MWSVVEKTALAEAEIEYHDHKSTTLWVKFPIIKSGNPALAGASVVIWTTTPWTIPANRAIAYGAEIEYAVYEVAAIHEGATAKIGDRLVIAKELSANFSASAKLELKAIDGKTDLAGMICAHPPARAGL